MPGRRLRGHREGSIYHRKDGRWCAEPPHVDGKRKFLYGKTRAEVARKLNRALEDIERGLPVPDDRLTVKGWLTHWLEDVARPGVRDSTYRSYKNLVYAHLIEELGRVKLVRLTPPDIERMMARRRAAGQTPANVAKMRTVLRRALTVAMQHGLIYRNVAALTSPPRVEKHEPRPLTIDEFKRFIAALDDDPLRSLYLVDVTTGLRLGELLGLDWSDVDLDEARLTVRQQVRRVPGQGIQVLRPKTSASRRSAELPQIAVAALREHRRRQVADRLQLGNAWIGSPLGDFVFTTPLGTPLDPSNISHRYKKVLTRAGLADRRFHDLRVTFGSLLIDQGEDIKVVSELMGHASIALTSSTYVLVMDRRRKEAAARFDGLLSVAPADRSFDRNADAPLSETGILPEREVRHG